MAKLILNDTVKRYGKIAIAKTKTIKVELDGKKIEIPPSCSLTLDTNLGEHTLRTYASILSNIYEFGVLAIAYAILQKKGAFIIKIKNNSEKTDENLKTLKNSE